MSQADRVRAAEAYIRAIRSGEFSAGQRAKPFLADDVVLTAALGAGTTEYKGQDEMYARIAGQLGATAYYSMGGWSDPVAVGDTLVVNAEIPALGNGARGAKVTFEFNAKDQIQSVREEQIPGPKTEATTEIPLVARGLINNAFANHTPMVVAYVSDEGLPMLSLRGSTAVFSPTQISVWLRDAEGGLSKALATNPNISLLYRDSQTRSSLIITGIGHIATTQEDRDRAYELAPESEQMHDPTRHGAALIVDVTRMRGGTPVGGVNVQPER
jgi:hypothetical protein